MNEGFRDLSELREIVLRNKIPQHIAVIPDGNRRYARKYGLTIIEAYRRGVEKAKEFAEWCQDIGVKYLTFYSLSLENLQRRPREELNILFNLMRVYFRELIEDKRIHENEVRIRIVGRINLLPRDLIDLISKVERTTEEYERYHITFLIAYSGRAEIVDAVKKILAETPYNHEITEDFFRKFLYLPDVPDPDLVIRTSGEQRISNFLLWYLAYSEFFFIKKYWPEITLEDLLLVLREFQLRERRFGR